MFHLAFIIPDLIFANQQSDCVRSSVPNISLTLETWLKTDGYVRIGLLIALMLIAIFFCLSKEVGTVLLIMYVVFMVIVSIFFFAWAIVGAIMFWGHLNPSGVCSGGVQVYMHVILIVSFVSVFCNCLVSRFGGGR